jgi:hypothetical protein
VFSEEFEHAYGGQAWAEADDDDDGLGYYPDGVKRTLTDEQIEMFRHSELHAIERKKAKEEERGVSTAPTEGNTDSLTESTADIIDVEQTKEHAAGEEGQALDQAARKKKRQRKGKTANQMREPKPDLRKRTWDVVESGLDSLDYG